MRRLIWLGGEVFSWFIVVALYLFVLSRGRILR